MWTTEVHDVCGSDSELADGGNDTVTPPSLGFVVAVGRAGSVVRDVVVRGREVVGAGVCAPPPPVAGAVVGLDATVVGAAAGGAAVGAGAWVVTGAGSGAGAAGAAAGAAAGSVGGGAAATLAVSAPDATIPRTATSPGRSRVRAVSRRAMSPKGTEVRPPVPVERDRCPVAPLTSGRDLSHRAIWARNRRRSATVPRPDLRRAGWRG